MAETHGKHRDLGHNGRASMNNREIWAIMAQISLLFMDALPLWPRSLCLRGFLPLWPRSLCFIRFVIMAQFPWVFGKQYVDINVSEQKPCENMVFENENVDVNEDGACL